VLLGAALPLTKTIACRDGAYAVAPYPHVSKLTSFHETTDSLAGFQSLLSKHAAEGHCLFNGQLQQPLANESRAGKTLKGAPREWVVFDFDKVEAKDHAEVVQRYLPAECQGVSYVAQHSASMFKPGTAAWSGHVFMLLKEPSTELQLREWFEALNFTIPSLSEGLALTDSGLGLHWPLDRSAAYDSKLIYIAPPRMHGFTPAIDPKQAIQLVKKKQSHLKLPAFKPVTKREIEDRINDLRKDAGLEAKDFRSRPFEDGEILIEAEEGVITGVRPMGEHYIKFNLNGGDSLGYWIDLRNPSVIKNFKGEPWLLTQQVDEKFYKQLSKTASRVISRPPIGEGTEVLAFYATNQNSRIKIGLFEPVVSKLTINTSTETAARSWLAEFGVIGGGFLPHVDITFDPTSDIQYVPNGTFLNTFAPTPYMKADKTSDTPSTLQELPAVINKLLFSVLGNPTPEVYTHFINWLAFIFQTRQKSETAWVISGRTGTGKGTFVKHVLRPLFGTDVVKNVQYTALNNEFNGYLESSIFVVFEECDTKAVANGAELSAKLNHYVTDSPIQIRRMQTDHYETPNYSNFFFFTNKHTPVEITKDNRRYNIAERQEQQIFFTPNEILSLQRGTELDRFADVLKRWPVNEAAVRRIITTQASEDMHEATTSINQQIADAIGQGNLQFFLDRIPSNEEASADFFNRFNPLGLLKPKLDAYIGAASKGESMLLKEDTDLFVLFRALIPDLRYFQDSKTWRRRHYKSLGLDIDKKHRVPGTWDKQARGVLVQWKLPAGASVPDPTGKVVEMKKRRKAQ